MKELNLFERFTHAVADENVDAKLLKELNDWDRSPKGDLVLKFTKVLQATFDYVHPLLALQNIDYNAICNEQYPLGGNHMNDLVSGPRYLNLYLGEANSVMRDANPALYAQFDRESPTIKYKAPSR